MARNVHDPLPDLDTSAAAAAPSEIERESRSDDDWMIGNLLFVVNYPSGTGFAWRFIEELYAGVATRLESRGVRTSVAYPALDVSPSALEGSPARPVLFDFRISTPGAVARTARKLRELEVETLYLPDRAPWHPAYPVLRSAGVERIIVHDHTSGHRTRPGPVKAAVKEARGRIPGTVADIVVAVSDFVRERLIEVNRLPPDRVVRLWNSVTTPPAGRWETGTLRSIVEVPSHRPVICAAGRASEEKGYAHLFRAFDGLCAGWSDDGSRPLLAYIGDGPYIAELRTLKSRLTFGDDIVMLGYRDDAADLQGEADLCVVPSTWAEAFGLSALEPMARATPVVASRAGGLPEVVVDGRTGILVAPGDERQLQEAMDRILRDPDLRASMGAAARERALEQFSRSRQVRELTRIITGEPTARAGGVGPGSGGSAMSHEAAPGIGPVECAADG